MGQDFFDRGSIELNSTGDQQHGDAGPAGVNSATSRQSRAVRTVSRGWFMRSAPTPAAARVPCAHEARVVSHDADRICMGDDKAVNAKHRRVPGRRSRRLERTMRRARGKIAPANELAKRRRLALLALGLGLLTAGCSVKKFAINKIGDSLANSGTTFASDNDPELIGEALPFSLKLIESLLAESPKHRGLLLAATMDFTQYAYAFVQQPSEEIESTDVEKSNALRTRARLLYLRARDYGLRGLETRHRGFGAALRQEPKTAVEAAKRKDVPLLYWTAVSWGAAIAQSKDRPDLVAEQPVVEALVDRAYALNPNFDHGAIEQFLISYESARQGGKGDFAARSRLHLEKAVKLSGGQLASPYVAYAETVCVQKQDRGEFEAMIRRALEIDPDARPEWRLNNLVIQRRARWLLSRSDELFLEKSVSGGWR
jgi:predicted anti-sigma-YlaC factor YlaD